MTNNARYIGWPRPKTLTAAWPAGSLPSRTTTFRYAIAPHHVVLNGPRLPWSKEEKRRFSTTIVLDSWKACGGKAGLLTPRGCFSLITYPQRDARRVYKGRISTRMVSDGPCSKADALPLHFFPTEYSSELPKRSVKHWCRRDRHRAWDQRRSIPHCHRAPCWRDPRMGFLPHHTPPAHFHQST